MLEAKRWIRSILVSALVALSISLDDNSRRVFKKIDDLPFDENGKLNTHLFLYPEGPCADRFDKEVPNRNYYLRELHPVGADLQKAFKFNKILTEDVAVSDFKECPAVCVEIGVDKSVVSSPMPNFYYDGVENVRQFIESRCDQVEVGFLQYNSNAINVHWVDYGGNRIFQYQILRGDKHTKFITSYVGHVFIFEDDETKEVLLQYKVQHTGLIRIGHHKNAQYNRDIDREVLSTEEEEWRRHKRVTRSFSPLGFKKGRLPDDLWGSLGAYYYNNKGSATVEEWAGKGLFVNWWETDVKFVQVPWQLKQVWQDRLRLLVEKWTGIELENTDLYGMRQYEKGARLLTHVDRVSTHAASLIINIEQVNVTKPWTVEVLDHADRLHEVVMKPGDIVYYESAKCLHGRNTPLHSGAYINLFAHYRPKGDPQWYTRENPEWSPQPLIDVGECRLVGKPDQYSQSAVQCDSPEIGPHLSPSMFVAKDGKDLFDWWKNVGPKNTEEKHDEL